LARRRRVAHGYGFIERYIAYVRHRWNATVTLSAAFSTAQRRKTLALKHGRSACAASRLAAATFPFQRRSRAFSGGLMVQRDSAVRACAFLWQLFISLLGANCLYAPCALSLAHDARQRLPDIAAALYVYM